MQPVRQVHKRLNIKLPGNLSSVSGYVPEGKDSTYPHKNMHRKVIAALLTINDSQQVEIARCPPTDEWINKMWSLLRMEYNSGIRRNKSLTPDTAWMNLGSMMLSEKPVTRG